jgi:spermidine synthase
MTSLMHPPGHCCSTPVSDSVALVFEHRTAEKHYEVRSAGRTVRLYTNRAFHSQWHPEHLFTGAVWDLLVLPVLYSSTAPRSVLLLGVGGGAVIHAINRLFPEIPIDGVELDPIHLRIARQFFNINYKNTRLIADDAVNYIASSNAKVDVLIDDLFVDGSDDPKRPVNIHQDWLSRLANRVSKHGVLIQNHLDTARARQTIRDNRPLLRRHFSEARLFTTDTFTNAILALYRQPVTRQRPDVIHDLQQDGHRAACRRLRFRSSRIPL